MNPAHSRSCLIEHLRSTDARMLFGARYRARSTRPAWIETRVRNAIETGEWSRF